MIVYISGPITGVPDFRERFQAAADQLLAMGHTVVNPAGMESLVDGEVTYDLILQMDLALLDCCDAICMLPGWEASNGARAEFRRAKELRKLVMIATETEEATG